MNAFEKLQETLRQSQQPEIPKGYKNAREIARESGANYETVRQQLLLARDKGLVEWKSILVSGHHTIYYKLK